MLDKRKERCDNNIMMNEVINDLISGNMKVLGLMNLIISRFDENDDDHLNAQAIINFVTMQILVLSAIKENQNAAKA
jgi:hypothetical protein